MDAPDLWWSPSLAEQASDPHGGILFPGLPGGTTCSVYRDGWDIVERPADAVPLVLAEEPERPLTPEQYQRTVDLCARVVDAARSDDGGPTVAGSLLGQLAGLLVEPVDEKGRGESYWRGFADGRMAERAEGVGPGSCDEDYEHVAFAGGDDPADAAIVQFFGTDRAAAEEHARWLVEGGVARRRDPEASACRWELIDGWQDPDGESWVRNEPPFAPELADAPIVTGESGAPAPLVVDHPVHDSTLPAEMRESPAVAKAREMRADPDRYFAAARERAEQQVRDEREGRQ